jgi:phycocyanin-associated rod protein
MMGQTAFGSTTTTLSGRRIFVYEVTGLRQTEASDNNTYPIRHSGSVFVKVPYARMNEEMQRITRLGGKIVSIKPLLAHGEADGNQDSAAKGK